MVKWISLLASNQPLRVRIVPGAQLIFKLMKKFILVFFASLAILFLFFGLTFAANCPEPIFCIENNGGLVPCGNNVTFGANGCIISGCPCQIGHFFVMATIIYSFVVKYVVTSLAVIMIIVGAIFILTSAGDPGRAGTGRKMIYSAIIGLVLVFGSWLIIDVLLKTIGYSGNWASFQPTP